MQQSRQAGLISNLRQIGQAAELYSQSSDGVVVTSPRAMVTGGALLARFLVSAEDRTADGWFNEFVEKGSRNNAGFRHRRYETKNSMYALGDVFRSRDFSAHPVFRRREIRGWLICFTGPNVSGSMGIEGSPFHRLAFDGSVTYRPGISQGHSISYADWYTQ